MWSNGVEPLKAPVTMPTMEEDSKPGNIWGFIATVGSGIMNWLFNRPDPEKKSPYLCDSCKYNDSRYCNRPDRPNATKCAEYKKQ